MSSNNPESQGQDWPIYPGAPGPAGSDRGVSKPSEPDPFPEPVEGRRSSEPPYRSSEPVEERRSSEPLEQRYADPTPRDDAYGAYHSYAHQQPTDPRHFSGRTPEPVEGPPRRPGSSSALQKKYVWIAIGIVAALVITSIARGGFNLWPLIIFGAIAWWVVGNKRKC